jgi:hypothetical protein
MDQLGIADVPMDEPMPGGIGQLVQVLQMTGIG